MTRVQLTINGEARHLELDPRQSLLDVLRETLDLTGTKKGCNQGACGACTVLLDGRRVVSCLTLAVMHDGAEVTTIEGLAQGEALHPLQAAFIEQDAFQCGFCTPGQIMSGVGCIARGARPFGRRDPVLDERQHLPLRRLSGHCRGDRRRGGKELTMIPFSFEKATHASRTRSAPLPQAGAISPAAPR